MIFTAVEVSNISTSLDNVYGVAGKQKKTKNWSMLQISR